MFQRRTVSGKDIRASQRIVRKGNIPKLGIFLRRYFLIRFRINELIAECNESAPDGERIHMQVVADAVGVNRSTLANLTRLTREPVTNTALVECLCRYFLLRHPNFELPMLFEFTPSLEETTSTHIDELYPQRAARSGRG